MEVFPCSSNCLGNAISMSILNKAAFLFRVPTEVINRSGSYWGCLPEYGVVQVALDILTWYAMTRHSAGCLVGSAGQTTGLTNAILTNSHKLLTSVCSVICSDGYYSTFFLVANYGFDLCCLIFEILKIIHFFCRDFTYCEPIFIIIMRIAFGE